MSTALRLLLLLFSLSIADRSFAAACSEDMQRTMHDKLVGTWVSKNVEAGSCIYWYGANGQSKSTCKSGTSHADFVYEYTWDVDEECRFKLVQSMGGRAWPVTHHLHFFGNDEFAISDETEVPPYSRTYVRKVSQGSQASEGAKFWKRPSPAQPPKLEASSPVVVPTSMPDPAATSPLPQVYLAALRGRLVDAATGVPLEGALIGLQWSGQLVNGQQGYSSCLRAQDVATDKDGGFVIPKSMLQQAIGGGTLQMTWEVYKPGYEVTVAPYALVENVEHRLKRLPFKPDSPSNRDLVLRYLKGSAEDIKKQGCGRQLSDQAGNVMARFVEAMVVEGAKIAKSDHERYLLEKIRAVYVPVSTQGPQIDIRGVSPSDQLSKVNWVKGKAQVQHYVPGPGEPVVHETTRLAIICSKGNINAADDACDINMRRSNGNTLLIDSIDNPEYVEQLLKLGADPSIEDVDHRNNALSCLVKRMYFEGHVDEKAPLCAGFVDPSRSQYDPPAPKLSYAVADQVLSLLLADSRTRVMPDIRAVMNDDNSWRLFPRRDDPKSWKVPEEGALRDFLLKVRERLKSVPDKENTVEFAVGSKIDGEIRRRVLQ